MLINNKNLEQTGKSWLRSCPSCSAVNNNLSMNCQKCGYKFEANLSPFDIASDEGKLLGNITTAKPKLIILLGTWFLFLPLIIIGIALVISQVLNEKGTLGFLFFWLGIIFIVIGLKTIYTVSKNYFTLKKEV